MKFVFLHGPPASGKFTIANLLEKQGYCKNFHNHLTIDVAKALFEFGSDEFWGLVDDLRITSLSHAARENTSDVVFTLCYNHPKDMDLVQRLKRATTEYGAQFIPIYLACEVSELERRVVSPHRSEMKKLCNVTDMRSYTATRNHIACPIDSCKTIDTTSLGPEQSVNKVVEIVGWKVR